MHERYGHENSALVAAFPTYQVKSAVRDFAKSLGLPGGEIERLARTVDPWQPGNDIEGDVARSHASRGGSPRWAALVELAREAAGLPRHISQHSGGMVISTQPLIDVCPIEPAAMEGRQMVQWDKDSCADAGLLKLDLLGLGMLSAVERSVEEIARVRGRAHRPVADRLRRPGGLRPRSRTPRPWACSRSRAAPRCRCCPRTRPENLDDLTVQVALVRPGPILGGAVHPYIERKKALREDPSYRGALRAPGAGAGAARTRSAPSSSRTR